MTKASENIFPKIIFVEGSTPSSPAAGDQKLFIDNSDHALKLVNSAGAVSKVGFAPTATGTYASIPTAGTDGKLYLPTDGSAVWRDNGAAWYPFGPMYAFTTPPAAGWTWDNQGSATITTTNGETVMYSPSNTVGIALRVYKRAAPTPPYTITAAFTFSGFSGHDSATDPSFGLCFRSSGDGKISTLWVVSTSLGGPAVAVRKWTTSSSFSADYRNRTWTYGVMGQVIWMRLADNNTNRIYSLSGDGQNWIDYYSVGRTDFHTANEVGISMRVDGASGEAGYINLLSWKEA